MNKESKSIIIDLIIILFYIIGFFTLYFSKNTTLNIIIGVLIAMAELWSIYKNNASKNKIISEIDNLRMVYKENNNSELLLPILTIANGILYIALNPQLTGITIAFIILIISNTSRLIQYLKGVATICDDKIVFHDGAVFDFSQIVSIEYKHKYIFTGKNKILTVRTKEFSKNIVVDSKDDKLKSYLEEKIL